MAETEVVKIEGYNIERATEKAILISRDNREYWIPKSQIVAHSGNDEMPDSIVIPKWLADKKGLMPNDIDTRIACPESVEEANMLEASRKTAKWVEDQVELENERKASADYKDYQAAKAEEQGALFAEYEASRNPEA